MKLRQKPSGFLFWTILYTYIRRNRRTIVMIVSTNLLPSLAFVPWWPYDRYAFARQRRALAGRTRMALRTWQAQLPFRTLKSYTLVSLLSFFAGRPFDALKAIKQSTTKQTSGKQTRTVTRKAALVETAYSEWGWTMSG